MSWHTCNPMTQREDFIALAILPEANKSGLCRRFGISRKTAHKWLRRYAQGGAPALLDRPRRPKAHPWTSGAAVGAVLGLREEQPTWGPRKLRRRLADLGHGDLPARSTTLSHPAARGQGLPRRQPGGHGFHPL